MVRSTYCQDGDRSTERDNFMPSWRRLYIFLLSNFITFSAFAKDVTVFDVRRPIAMQNDEQQEKDYYINAGAADGLKAGVTVLVSRRHALYDQYQSKSPGDLVVVVGQLKIIYVQEDISVARLEKIYDRSELPTLEFDTIMMGDKVDLSTAKSAPKKTASLDE